MTAAPSPTASPEAMHVVEHGARPISPTGSSAASRLEQTAGRELARLLVKALAGDHRARLA